jgi:hypothetical protein
MNVNLWGPSFWSILHASAFLADQDKKNFDPIVRPLKDLLPCIHCRRSFGIYYEILGKPEQCAKWVYDAHNLVNDKLNEQAIDRTVQTFAPGNMDFKMLLMTSMKTLYQSPSFEVVTKRYYFAKEHFSHEDVSTIVLAFASVAKEPNAPYTFDACLAWLKDLYGLTKSKTILSAMKAMESTDVYSSAIKFKYGEDTETTRKYASYLKAGACIDYTCQ